MSPMVMTSRERVYRMFERRDHDRVPRHDTFWNETIDRWRREGLEGGADDVLQILGSDFHPVAGSWPSPFPGQARTLQEDADTSVFVDDWGATVRCWKHRSGTPEHIAFGCDSRKRWEDIYRPIYQDLKIPFDADEVRGAIRLDILQCCPP